MQRPRQGYERDKGRLEDNRDQERGEGGERGRGCKDREREIQREMQIDQVGDQERGERISNGYTHTGEARDLTWQDQSMPKEAEG